MVFNVVEHHFKNLDVCFLDTSIVLNPFNSFFQLWWLFGPALTRCSTPSSSRSALFSRAAVVLSTAGVPLSSGKQRVLFFRHPAYKVLCGSVLAGTGDGRASHDLAMVNIHIMHALHLSLFPRSFSRFPGMLEYQGKYDAQASPEVRVQLLSNVAYSNDKQLQARNRFCEGKVLRG